MVLLLAPATRLHTQVAMHRTYSRVATDYGKALMMKFIFQVHPDYFENHKAMQRVNATNLSILHNLIDGSIPIATSVARGLVFYIKPLADDIAPKRVKVSVHRLEKSIVEILETIGVDIPPATESSHSRRGTGKHSSTILASPKQTLEYLDSMQERKDLVAWREEHTRVLRRKEEVLLAITGARSIQYRNSWSAQNNAIMLSRLITLIKQHIQTIAIPWTNMHIVFAKDASEFRLNYLDQEIILDPTDVPDQWLVVLQSVNPDAIHEVQLHAQKFDILHSKFESMVCNALLQGMQGVLDGNVDAIESTVSAHNIHVHVKRGFTCSLTNYYYFLHKMNQKLNVVEVPGLHSTTNSSSGDPEQLHATAESGVQLRPLEVNIVVEDAHGTRLLPDGTFRIDVRADLGDVQALLLEGSKRLPELLQRHYEEQCEIEALITSLTRTIQWLSIRPGVGVSSTQLLVCLQRMDEYLRVPQAKSALLQLSGMRVQVGHYLGMADDGSCIVPWEIALPTGDTSEVEESDSE